MRTRRTACALTLMAGLAVSGCATEPPTTQAAPPAVVEDVAGSDLKSVTLTEEAAERTGIRLEAVAARSAPAIPYSALLYDPDGKTWVYVVRKPNVYVRHAVTVDAIEGDVVTLTDGPASGTEIVSVGVAELYGAELGIGQ